MGLNKPIVILALDISSSSTGYAVLKSGRWSNNTKSHGIIKISPKLTLAERLHSFRDEVQKILEEVKPNKVIIEDVFSSRNVSTMKLLSRFNGVGIEVVKRVTGDDPVIALTSAVRGLLGCGRSKEEAFAFIKDKYKLDWSFNAMNDVADALALALYAHKKSQEK